MIRDDFIKQQDITYLDRKHKKMSWHLHQNLAISLRTWAVSHLDSIFCNSSLHLHPNDSFFRDSQSGVPKLSRFGLLRLWAFITSRLKLGSGQGFNQSCSSPWELSNGVSHFTYTHRNRVDSWLLVVGSQTGSLTPDPSFDQNLCCKYSNC
jgi:hypothetical protein